MTDGLLLQQYATSRDAEAFQQIVERYGDFVYSTCLRITRNPHDAEDAAQECFLSLARKAGTIRSSLPGWLHATARHASMALVKLSRKRRDREMFVAPTEDSPSEPGWHDLEPHIDAAIQQLPQELQSPIILHFLQARPQSAVADILGLDQSTVSRRLKKGIEALRRQVRKAGLVLSVSALVSCLGQSSLEAAPATLKAALGKMALAGVGDPAAAAPAAVLARPEPAVFATLQGKLAAALVAAVLLFAGIMAYRAARETVPATPRTAVPPAVAPSPPAPESDERTRTLDYSQIELKGDGHARDSFSLVIQAAAHLLGVEADYETIYALSTNAFVLALDRGESCKSWWTDLGREQGIDLIAGRLGLGWHRITLEEITRGRQTTPQEPPEGPEKERWFAEYYRKPWIATLRKAMNDGQVVITQGGWKVRGLYGFNPWCWWGVITEVRDDGTILGACLNGRRDNPVEYITGVLVLSRGEPTLTPVDADRAMLGRAAIRISGDAALFWTGETRTPAMKQRCADGLRAMDLWIEQMGQVPYCPDCKEKSAGCARDTALPVYSGAEAAASYLRRRAADFPEGARTHMESLARRYDRIAALLRPALTGQGGMKYEDFIGVAEKQKPHADDVLRQCRAEMSAALDDMDKVLAASRDPQDDPAGFNRLPEWHRVFGASGLARAADREPPLGGLWKAGPALDPASEHARQIRQRMALEPAMSSYAAQVEALLTSIAAGRLTGPWPAERTPERKLRLASLAAALQCWSEGGRSPAGGEAVDAATLDEVSRTLGAADREKKTIVAYVIEKLRTNNVPKDLYDIEKQFMAAQSQGRDPGPLLTCLSHNITMLDTQCWSFEHNLTILLDSISRKKVTVPWGRKDGPLGWYGIDPKARPRIDVVVRALDAWLSGKDAPDGESRAMVEQLGRRDNYKEKEWLARSFFYMLRLHQAASDAMPPYADRVSR